MVTQGVELMVTKCDDDHPTNRAICLWKMDSQSFAKSFCLAQMEIEIRGILCFILWQANVDPICLFFWLFGRFPLLVDLFSLHDHYNSRTPLSDAATPIILHSTNWSAAS